MLALGILLLLFKNNADKNLKDNVDPYIVAIKQKVPLL